MLKSNTSTGAAVKRYWSIGGNTLAEGDGTGNLTAEYIYFGGKRVARIDLPANTVHYYLSDHLGSTSIVASSAGAVEEESDYYPFGTEVMVTGPGTNELKFTGKRRDAESQLDYFGARYYSNILGRWLSPDWSRNAVPLPYASIDDTRSLNQYGYVVGNPINRLDSDGHKVEYLQQKRTAEEANRRVLGNVSKSERGLFRMEQNKDTKKFELKLDTKAAANFKGEHTEGYTRLVKAIDSDKTALISIQSTIRLTDEAGSRMFDVDKDLGGGVTQYLDSGNVLVVLAPDGNKSASPDMQHTLGPNGTKIPDPPSIIAGHELLGHGLEWMTAGNVSESNAVKIEKQLRQEQNISPRVP